MSLQNSNAVIAKQTNFRMFTVQGTPWPDNAPQFRFCTLIQGLSQGLGDSETLRCPHPKFYGRWKIVGRTQDPPDDPEYSMVSRMPLASRTWSVTLAKEKGKITAYALGGESKRASRFEGFSKAIVIEGSQFTNLDIDPLMDLTEDTEINVTSDLTAEAWYEFGTPTISIYEPYNDVQIAKTTQVLYIPDETRKLEDRFIIFTASRPSDAAIVGNGAGQQSYVIWSTDLGATWNRRSIEGISLSDEGGTLRNPFLTLFKGTVVISSNSDVGYSYIPIEDILNNTGSWTRVAQLSGAGATWAYTFVDPSTDILHMAGHSGRHYIVEEPGDFTIVEGVPNAFPTAVAAKNNVVAVGRNDGDLNVSTDGGYNFTQLSTGQVSNPLSIVVEDRNHIAFSTVAGTFHYTSDGGVTWGTFVPSADNYLRILQSSPTLWWTSSNNRVGYNIAGGNANQWSYHVHSKNFVEVSNAHSDPGFPLLMASTGADNFGGDVQIVIARSF